MAFSSNGLKVKPIDASSIHPFWQRLSQRSLKAIIVGGVVCIVIGFLTLWQPAYYRLYSLKEEKTYWEEVLGKGVIYTSTVIPSMDQLPDMIELCRSMFVKQGIKVVSLNVERFGERKETGKSPGIDYALVRLRLLGQWEGIVRSLKALEEMPEISIHAQEIVLTEDAGEALLQIYFCTGEVCGNKI